MTINPETVAPDIADKSPPAQFELKAAAFTLPVVRLLGTDMDAVAEQLGAKVDQAPDFFRNTPVVVDLSGLAPGTDDVQFPLLVGLLRGYGMIPVGVRGGDASHNQAAEAMELAILGDVHVRRPHSKSKPPQSRQVASRPTAIKPAPTPGHEALGGDRIPAPTPSNSHAAGFPSGTRPEAASGVASSPASNPRPSPKPSPGKPGPGSPFKVVSGPIRSGQRIYAAGGDLSIIGAVSSGAELLADGNIHVYGPLRGRAIAGNNGDPAARIFCQNLQAELVSVAGHYRVSENIPATLRGMPVQVFLDQEVLRIEKL